MADVSISLGTESSQINNSDISIGDVAGGNLTSRQRHLDSLLQQVSELGRRVQRIEEAFTGTLNVTGLTQELHYIRNRTVQIEEDIRELQEVDKYYERESRRVEHQLQQYLPLLQKISATYDGTRTMSSQTYNLVMAVLVIVSVAMIIVLFYGANQ